MSSVELKEGYTERLERRVFPSFDNSHYDSERYRTNSINNFRQMNTSMDLSNVMMSSHPTTSITTSIPKIRCKFIVAMEAAVMHINNLPSDEDFKENENEQPGGSSQDIEIPSIGY